MNFSAFFLLKIHEVAEGDVQRISDYHEAKSRENSVGMINVAYYEQ